MANNVFKIKRTSVTGRAANTSTLTNPGELALNITDGIMFSTNGSTIFEVGANLTSAHITNSLTLDNDKRIYFKTLNASACTFFVNQLDDNFVLYTTNTSYQPRPVFSIYANSNISTLNFVAPTRFDANVTVITANGSVGSAGQVLTSNGSSVYWSTVSGGGSVNTSAQYTWTNTHTFQANVAFTGNNISLVSNTGSVFFGGSSDSNWRIGRSTGATTKFYYTNNSLDIIAADSNLEGVVIGKPGGNTYLETGYAGTFTKNPIYVGNSSVNVSINSTSFSGTSLTANNASYLGGNSASDLITYSDNKAGNAYSNAVSYVDGKSYVNTSQLSSNLSNYVTTTNLSNNLANYQTTAGLAANVALLAANSATYLGNSSGTIANVASWITTNAAAAYTNAVSYVDGKSYVNTSQLSSNLSNYVTTTNLSNNLANYQTTAGLAANVATLTSNNSTFAFGKTEGALNVNSALTANNSTNLGGTAAASYQLNSTLNANIASYLPIYTGTVNGAIFSVGSSFIANTTGVYHTGTVNGATISTGSINVINSSGLTTSANVNIAATGELVITAGAGIFANGGLGSAGQLLYSNGSSVYWANAAGGGATLTANTTDTATYYFPMSNTSSGAWSNGVVANTKLYFVPGTGTLSATIFNSLSDAEYKTNVNTVENALSIISELRGVRFNWKEDNRPSVGVIAQEVEKVVPELVTVHNKKKSVNYDGLIGILIESIKELKQEIEDLKSLK